MTKKIRLILLFSLVFLYLIVAPVLVVYSLGYRVDFENRKLVSIGGIYLKIWPQEVEIRINGKIERKTGPFSNQTLIQGLFPKKHNFSVQKAGYHPWQKTLETKSREVIRVENITLIKEEIIFSKIGDEINYFSLSPNNKIVLSLKNSAGLTIFKLFDAETGIEKHTFEILNPKISTFNIIWSQDSSRFLIEKENIKLPFEYFIFEVDKIEENNPRPINLIAELENSNLPVYDVVFNPNNPDEIFFKRGNRLYLKGQKTSGVIKDLITYSISGNQIIWIANSGHVFKSDLAGKKISAFNEKPFTLKEKSIYRITVAGSFVFLGEDGNLFLFDEKTKDFEKFYDSINNLKISPKNDKILYFTNHEILFSELARPPEKVSILRFSETVKDCFWLNNDYLIFNVGGKIKISEIDVKDRINVVELPTAVSLNDNTSLEIRNPEIQWDSINKKLYIFDQNNLLVSEPLTDRNNK